ncbi:MAG: hypothetical protein U0074_06765 [Kouleothrix sp.]
MTALEIILLLALIAALMLAFWLWRRRVTIEKAHYRPPSFLPPCFAWQPMRLMLAW